MKYIEAIEPEPTWPILFLAGGITGCPDWQAEMVEHLMDVEELTVVNPRRANFPINDNSAAFEQIAWEFKMLEKADMISFWFPKETLCPITLFELGKWIHTNPVIGVEYGYQRALDIRVQGRLELGSDFEIFDSVEDMAWEIKHRRLG